MARNASLPAIPKVGSKLSAAMVEDIEQKIAEILPSINSIEEADEARAKSAALETYLRGKELKGPMMGAQRRCEARIGQLLGEPEKGGRGKLSRTNDSFDRDDRNRIADFRLFAKILNGKLKLKKPLADEDWRISRRGFVALVRDRLGIKPEVPEVPVAFGEYSVIVIDPPWPMEKIERHERPKQTDMPYEVVYSLDQITDLELPAAEDCHLWCWTTNKFLPAAMEAVEAWGFSYICTFVWHKPGGFQPVGLPQYNCEFALYCRKGSPKFTTTKDFPLCFNAPRGKHSEKPDKFYDTVRRVTRGKRLDMFSRRKINGFKGWGNEAK